MKITIKLLAVTAILFVLLTPAGSASAEVFKYTNADAYFNSTDGCILTDIMIFVWEEGIYSVSILQHDFCQDLRLIEAYGNKQLSKSEIKFTGNLKSATLNTTVQVFDDFRNISMDVDIDLTWIGIGDIRVYGREKYRDAVAFGTVSNGMTNFTPDPSTQAVIYSAKWK